MQAARRTERSPLANVRPIVATAVGIPAVVIVVAAANGNVLPWVGDGLGALLALWVLGAVMCSLGISAMRDRFGLGRADVVGLPLGLLATALLLSGIFGWSLLLRPIADAMGGDAATVSLPRAAIVGVGVVMLAKWAIAWLSYLPRATARRSTDA